MLLYYKLFPPTCTLVQIMLYIVHCDNVWKYKIYLYKFQKQVEKKASCEPLWSVYSMHK